MENIKINDRLLTAPPFIREGGRLADIGTDHAYLPIYLICNNKISTAIAADINQGPLDKSRENIQKYGCEDRIRTVLCNGLSKIDPNEVDDIAIFGMGGELIIEIISDTKWLKHNTQKRLILQPMTHPEKLRKYLLDNGFKIIGEALSCDRGKIYQTICAEFDGVRRECNPMSLHFGEHILNTEGELLFELLSDTQRKLERKLKGKRLGGEDCSAEESLLNDIREYMKGRYYDGKRIK